MAINRSNINLQVTRGNKMKQLKDIPEGNKGKGLSKLPTSVRNNMGFKKQGGVIKAQSGTGKDPILSKEERSKEGMEYKPGKKGGQRFKDFRRKQRLEDIRKPTLKDIRKRVKRKRRIAAKKGTPGGMAYQLYGGSTKNFSDGNKFIQSFYDKGE